MKTIPLPHSEQQIQARIDEGWFFAFPPEDYEGSIADWRVAMAERGYPEQYEELTSVMVPKEVWEEVLEECES